MNVFEIDPTADERWDRFVERHPHASIFHTRSWLEALRRTYGYSVRAVTGSEPGVELRSGIPFCEVNGLFGKRRLVSLPFSDHCHPLYETEEQLRGLISHLQARRDAEKWNYLELRPVEPIARIAGLEVSERFAFHRLNLRRGSKEVLSGVHKDCIQRKIRRAEKAGLTVEDGRTDELIHKFYQLLVITRRRHGLPAQPIQWFRNLVSGFGSKLTISIASFSGQPVAGIITIQHGRTLVYKYGGSDHRFFPLGGMQLLLWRAIQQGLQDESGELDLGRSDLDDAGLVAFKNRWGAEQSILSYRRAGSMPSKPLAKTYQSSLGRYVREHAPKSLLTAAGRFLYRQLG